MTGDAASDHATEEADHDSDHAGSAGGSDHAEPAGVFRGLIATVIAAARTRLDLAAVETEIFLLRTVQMLLWALAAVACGLLALVFAIVALIAALWDSHRMLGVLGGAGLFVVLAGVFGYIAARTFKAKPILEGTLQQLETDEKHVSGNP
jgi:uncharacterized membrane protein YqjE